MFCFYFLWVEKGSIKERKKGIGKYFDVEKEDGVKERIGIREKGECEGVGS